MCVETNGGDGRQGKHLQYFAQTRQVADREASKGQSGKNGARVGTRGLAEIICVARFAE